MALPPERVERFREAVAALAPETAILIAQVDPDAIGSACAIARALEHVRDDLDVTIYYCGAVGHPQNRALINRYDLATRLRPISDLAEGASPSWVLVDSSLLKDSRLPAGVTLDDPRIVIDHHRRGEVAEEDDRFVWVEDVGAAATLVSELLEATGVDVGEETGVAVLLALGIYTDTKSLVSASERDREAYGRVTRYVVPRELQQLIDYPLPESHFTNLRLALSNSEQRGARLVAGVGRMDASSGDDLSTIADLLLRKSGVTLVVVWGIVDDAVRISARSSDVSTPLDEFLRERFGDASGAKLTPDGKGEGGARVALDLGPWMSEANKPEVEAMVGKRITEWIFGE